VGIMGAYQPTLNPPQSRSSSHVSDLEPQQAGSSSAPRWHLVMPDEDCLRKGHLLTLRLPAGFAQLLLLAGTTVAYEACEAVSDGTRCLVCALP
jgi:hypothetical protein